MLYFQFFVYSDLHRKMILITNQRISWVLFGEITLDKKNLTLLYLCVYKIQTGNLEQI